MRRFGGVLAASCAAMLAGTSAYAQGPDAASPQSAAAPQAAPLRLDAVLAASAQHFPLVLEGLALRQAADGRALAAQGAFDLVVASEGRARASGFWNGRAINTSFSKPIAPFGASVFGAYRLADGTFPIYEDANFTNRLGEFKVGVLLSLLRDRAFDQRRFLLLDTQLQLRNADFELLLARVGVQHQAMIAYNNWMFAGLQLQVYRDLLKIALERQDSLARQVARGQRAAIVLTENQQNVLRREILVAEAERSADAAATILALYWRDPLGAPTMPSPAQRPEAPLAVDPELVAGAIASSGEALAARPDLGLLRTETARADARVRLSRNELKPDLDFSYEIARDIGDIQEGGPSRDGLDNIVGFKFAVPLERRAARGRLQEAEAARRALVFRLRQRTEQIAAEVENIRIDLVATERLVHLATQEVAQAQAMQRAEVQLFDGGASDFFRLNLREEQAADARIRTLQAQLRRQAALANLFAATVNLPQLGLAEIAAAPG